MGAYFLEDPVLRSFIMKIEYSNTEQEDITLMPKIQAVQLVANIMATVKSDRYWKIEDITGKALFIFDSVTHLLWPLTLKKAKALTPKEAEQAIVNYRDGTLKNWVIPTKEQLWYFSKDSRNPLRSSKMNQSWLSSHYIAVVGGRFDPVKKDSFNVRKTGSLFPYNRLLKSKSGFNLIKTLEERCWALVSCRTNKKLVINNQIRQYAKNINDGCTSSIQDEVNEFLERNKEMWSLYNNIDFNRTRLPKIELTQFTDPKKGMWEFYNNDLTSAAEKQGLRHRNPTLDVVTNTYVGIDFGTSSTVVSFMDKGEGKLLRVGVQDFYKPIEQHHFENPTVLEFIDIPQLLSVWQSEAYKPEVNWEHVHCSHEAEARLRDNDGDTQVLASILTKMKQWALRVEEESQKVSVIDFNNQIELSLEALTLRKLIKGQPLEVSNKDLFDPIELYAWFLGLNINWRQRGLFLKYLMTFPIGYSRQVKDKILASFSRGLQRSLPKELVNQEAFETFSVEECASEPAAYAASALPALGIEPTEKGVAYAVFDFGGGTTDFDFGIYRKATEKEEQDYDYDQAFEHFFVAGDPFLGGENLLENMAYQVFQSNLEVCRTNRIVFTCPLEAKSFSGSEMFIDRTQAAQTNTQLMITRLRPLWEKGELTSNGILRLGLLNRDGEKINCEIEVDPMLLGNYLESRIRQGVHSFYHSMKIAFEGKNIDTVHVLLAGNSSKSDIVTWIFSDVDSSILGDKLNKHQEQSDDYFNCLYQGCSPQIKVHLPLKASDDNPHAPTCKTGVALGLLVLRPGSATKIINNISTKKEGEAPFAFHVGKIKRNTFIVGLKQFEAYETWHQIGVVRDRRFEMYATQSVNAIDNNLPMSDLSLSIIMLDFVGNTEKHKVFAKATGPKEIEICTAVNMCTLVRDEGQNSQIIRLK